MRSTGYVLHDDGGWEEMHNVTEYTVKLFCREHGARVGYITDPDGIRRRVHWPHMNRGDEEEWSYE